MVIIMNKQERLDKSIWETYRSMGAVLAEEPDPKHWNSWDLDPKNPKKGKLYSQKAGSQEVEGGNTPVPVKKRRTMVTTPADDLGIEGTKTHHTTTSNAVTTTDKKTGAWHTAVRTMDGTPLRIKRSTSVKGKIKNDDGTTKQVNVKNFPTKHSSMKESIINTYRNIGAILAEAEKAKASEIPGVPNEVGKLGRTPKERKAAKKVLSRNFPPAHNQDAHDAPRHSDGRRRT